MNYCTSFYSTCPQTGKENYIEVHFYRDEKPADRLEYWGTVISLPATNEVQIIRVFQGGKIWRDYPDFIVEEIYSHSWEKLHNKRA